MIDRQRLLEFAYLKEIGRNIRLHGNRFVQVDLNEEGSVRLHVWSDLLPLAQTRPTPIHDHTFAFESDVLSGTLLNQEYATHQAPYAWSNPEELMHVWCAVPRQDQDTALELQPALPLLVQPLRPPVTYGRGAFYRMEAGVFHATTYIGHAVTVMRRSLVVLLRQPRVLCRVGHRPDNAFNRYVYGEDLWSTVEHVLREVVHGDQH